MAKTYTRRRAIAIFAAAAGLPLLTGAKPAETSITWTGHALGAPATLILNHQDRAAAGRLIRRVVAEVSRLESVFSLYREDSALVELNRVGVLVAPSSDLVSLLRICRAVWEQTGGTFDPTVQPLWAVYRDHFSMVDPDPSGPSRAQIDSAVARVGFGGVQFDRDKVVMRSQMSITLNGIAQGYITDRIVEMLRDAGVTSSLVDMGEDRAIGTRADGSPWRIGLAESQDARHPDKVLDIVDMAVATSSAAGFQFDDAGRFGHIVDPHRGITPAIYRRVSVVAEDAATADALSTAFTVMEEDAIASVVKARPKLAVDLVRAGGLHTNFGAPA